MIKDYVAFDLETTGLNVETDYIIEIGALKVKDGKVCEGFREFVKPPTPISPMITNITDITNEMVAGARNTCDVIRDFVEFCEDFVLIGHNIMFDYKFTKKYASEYGFAFEKTGIDTLKIARKVLCNLESKSLGTLCEHYGIINQAAHRAYHDALATAKIYHYLAHDFEDKEPKLFIPESLHFKPKKVQPCTLRQVEYLRTLCTYHNISIQDNPENLTRSEMSRLIDSIITTHGKMYTE